MIGFIGAGNMASAIIKGVIKRKIMSAEQIAIYDIDDKVMKTLQETLGVSLFAHPADLIKQCNVVFIAVKPHIVSYVFAEQYEHFRDKAVFCIAAGWNGKTLREKLPSDARCLCIMPNTPALVGEGMTALSLDHTLRTGEKALAERIFASLGRVAWVEDRLLNAAVGVMGSSPAYAYMFIEALADGGVACGLSRKMAMEMAAQTLLGSAKMVLESGLHPGELKDMVASPGGTTIAAIRSLESDGFRGSVINAVCTASEKAALLK